MDRGSCQFTRTQFGNDDQSVGISCLATTPGDLTDVYDGHINQLFQTSLDSLRNSFCSE